MLEIVGKALNYANAADSSIIDQLSNLRAIVSMRNRIIHGYDKIDDELIWTTAATHVPKLKRETERLLERY